MRIAPDFNVDDAALAAVCDKYGIAELRIFGSRARGTASPGSDIDVLYTLRRGRKLGWEIEQLADELTGLLGHDVDVVSSRALHPQIRPAVLAEARPLYAA
jgi:predicted nucleotidyltransferase